MEMIQDILMDVTFGRVLTNPAATNGQGSIPGVPPIAFRVFKSALGANQNVYVNEDFNALKLNCGEAGLTLDRRVFLIAWDSKPTHNDLLDLSCWMDSNNLWFSGDIPHLYDLEQTIELEFANTERNMRLAPRPLSWFYRALDFFGVGHRNLIRYR